MQRVGHDDAETTLKIYTHVTEKMKKMLMRRSKIISLISLISDSCRECDFFVIL